MHSKLYKLTHRFHLTSYPQRARLRLTWLEARRFGFELTVCPSVYRRMNKFWRTVLSPSYLFDPQSMKADLMFMVRNKLNLRDIQQMLFSRYGLKIRIKTLKRWIMQRYVQERGQYWPFIKWT
jgi:hypothetical protein